jgi:hypothetical protein
MDERELDGILRDLARERHVPPEKLVRRTGAAVRGRRLFHVVAFLSLAMQVVTVGTGLYILASPEVSPIARAFTLVGLTAFFGAIATVVVVARRKVIYFFRRVERLTC